VQISLKNAEALVRLSQNPELRKRMGKTGRETMQREFDERLVVEGTMKAYHHGQC
jgi:hypothetical protein